MPILARTWKEPRRRARATQGIRGKKHLGHQCLCPRGEREAGPRQLLGEGRTAEDSVSWREEEGEPMSTHAHVFARMPLANDVFFALSPLTPCEPAHCLGAPPPAPQRKAGAAKRLLMTACPSLYLRECPVQLEEHRAWPLGADMTCQHV